MEVSVLELSAAGNHMLTRPEGKAVRDNIKALIESGARVHISFTGVHAPSPSFIDEALGRLVLDLGEDQFRRRVLLIADSATETVRRLTNKVLAHRIQQVRASQDSSEEA